MTAQVGTMTAPSLAVDNLSISYGTGARSLQAVRNVSFSIAKGEAYGLIGESGSGKTTIAYSILKYLRGGMIRQGRISVGGRDVLAMSAAELRDFRGNRAAMVFQDPMNSLNPSMRVGEQIAEALRHHKKLNSRDAFDAAMELLGRVHLPSPDAVARRYPHQLSGGQQQRVVIAMAIACEPELLILDEPTTGLDVTTQAVILDLLQELRARLGSSILFITHNLAVVAQTCDRVGVLYAGELVEEGRCGDVISSPQHPYTAGLLRSMPRHSETSATLKPIPGSIPDLTTPPGGCVFAARCEVSSEVCTRERPPALDVAPMHVSRCLFPERVPLLDADAGSVAVQAAAGRDGAQAADTVLELDKVSCTFRQRRGLPLVGPIHLTRAVDAVSLSVARGKTLAIVGESGSGKSTLARAIMGLLAPDRGDIRLDRATLAPGVAGRKLAVQRKVQMIFQNPDGALNPQLTVGEIIARPMQLYGTAEPGAIPKRVADLLDRVRLGTRYAARLPHELSGGEKQRVNIARVLAADPEIIVCDEPTSALDISVQASILNQLRELQDSTNVTYLFISHDLGVVRYISDSVAVMYRGRIVEYGPTETVFRGPQHPYTESLLEALPEINKMREPKAPTRLTPEAAGDDGCRYAPRCARRLDGKCERVAPELSATGDGRLMACHIPLDQLADLQRVPA